MTKSLRLLRVKYIMVSPVRFNTFSLVIFCCLLILRIRRRHCRRKVLIFFSFTLDKDHVSLPYIRVLDTQAQYTLNFVRIFHFGLSQTLAVRLVKFPEALPMRQLVCTMMRLTQYLSQSIQISLHFLHFCHRS